MHDSAAMLSVVIWLAPIHFVEIFFMLICFGGFCTCFVLLHFSSGKYIICWYRVQGFHCAAFLFNKYFPALGWLLLYFFLTCSFINRCSQYQFAHRMDDSAARLSIVIWLAPIHFVEVFLHVGLFWEVLQLLCLAALSERKYIVWCSFHPWSASLFFRGLLLRVAVFSFGARGIALVLGNSKGKTWADYKLLITT